MPEAPLPLSSIVIYGLPSAGLHFTFFLFALYLMKFSTDVLLLAPGVMGALYGVSRLWDAVSDPIAGHLSDRTRSRLGRRRSWLLASALPIAAGNLMIWGAPEGMAAGPLAVWMGVGLFVYFTGTTMFSVPHESLGAELSSNYHERTRIFGVKQAVSLCGSLAAVGVMQLLIQSDAPRPLAFQQSVVAVTVTAALLVLTVARVRERPEYQGRGGASLRGAFRDVLRNPHARILLLVFGIENFGTAILGIVTPFVMQYVLGMPEMTGRFIALYFIPALLFIPAWIHLSRRFGKKPMWLFSMSMLTLAFGGLFFVGPGDVAYVSVLGVIAGIGGGCGQVVGPSIQADVIDFDEYRTGERKEGIYFAVWNFVRKGAYGIAGVLTGVVLSVAGYEPNVEQTEAAKLGLRALFGVVPGACFAIGTLAFLRFRLTEVEHAAIRAALDRRS
ncbi:MAG: MFS transporter [Myxococcota bacterium]